MSDSTPVPKPPPAPAPHILFFDTSALMTMAVDESLQDAVVAAVGMSTKVLLDVVVDELDHRAKADGAGSLAAVAFTQLRWLGDPLNSTQFVSSTEVSDVQELVADGKALKHEREHWAEATAIAMFARSAAREEPSAVEKVLVTDDYSARVQAHKIDMATGWSIHRILWSQVQAGVVEASEASRMAGLISDAERGGTYEASDFEEPNRRRALARVGHP